MSETLETPDELELRVRTEAIVTAVRTAVKMAIDQHWRLGRPVAVWRDNRVVWLGPDGEVAPPE
jgi:hypothetical protein